MYKLIVIKSGQEFGYTIIRYLNGVLGNNLSGTGAYWYLYAYLGFLFMLPFMQRVAKKFTKAEFIMLLIVHFVVNSFIPLWNVIGDMLGFQPVQLCSDIVVPFAFTKAFFYTLIGYYLEYNIDIRKFRGRTAIRFIFIGLVGILLSNLCTYYEAATKGTYTQNYVQVFDYLTAIVAFLTIKVLTVMMTDKDHKIQTMKKIEFMGSLTFGIYLFDPILKVILYKRYEIIAEPMLPTLIVSFGWVMISMLCGGVLTYIMKKLPGIRKLL